MSSDEVDMHSTIVSSDEFDRLLRWLDEPASPSPALAAAAARADRVLDRHSTDFFCPQCLGHLSASADVCWHCGLYDPTARKDPHA